VEFVGATPWFICGELAKVAISRLYRIAYVTIEPWGDDDIEVTGTLLRELHLAAIRDEAVRYFLWAGEPRMQYDPKVRRFQFFPDETEARRDVVATARAETRRRGRPGYPDAFFQDIAQQLLHVCETIEGRDMYGPLSEQYQVPRDTMRSWVRRATQKGFLLPGEPGRTGRQPGPRLRSV
jgi:hypothetical protein